MQVLVELIAGLIAMLAAAALSSVGVDLNERQETREVRRVDDRESRPDPQKAIAVVSKSAAAVQDC